MSLIDIMGRPLSRFPTYVCEPNRHARIYWRGEYRTLPGLADSVESKSAFAQISEYIATHGQFPTQADPSATVADIGRMYMTWASAHYQGSSEARNLGYAVKALVDVCGGVPIAQFGPPQLKDVRSALIARGQCRNTVNARAKQIVAIVRWCVEEGHVPPSVWHALQAVRPIARGRDGAMDYEPVRPVADSDYQAALAKLPSRYRSAVMVQYLTGMRSGELLAMRPVDVDMSGRHWYYTPERHKTSHAIGDKVVGIVSRAADVLRGCMPTDPGQPWFSWRVDVHRTAVIRACRKAGVPPWHPHQLRHGVATRLATLYGEAGHEAARLVLAHTQTKTTSRYVMPTPATLEPILDRLENDD